MSRIIAFSHASRVGAFWIKLASDGLWHVMHQDDSLGAYSDPSSAAEEVANGYTYWPSSGDTSHLGLPEDISDWTPHFAR